MIQSNSDDTATSLKLANPFTGVLSATDIEALSKLANILTNNSPSNFTQTPPRSEPLVSKPPPGLNANKPATNINLPNLTPLPKKLPTMNTTPTIPSQNAPDALADYMKQINEFVNDKNDSPFDSIAMLTHIGITAKWGPGETIPSKRAAFKAIHYAYENNLLPKVLEIVNVSEVLKIDMNQIITLVAKK